MLKVLGYSLVLFSATVNLDNRRYLTNINTPILMDRPIHEVAQTPSLPNENSIANTLGVVTWTGEKSGDDSKTTIKLYNHDGSLWSEISFYEDSDRKPDDLNPDFNPFVFHRDYFLLALKCMGADANRYEVIANESTGLRKYVKKSDRAMKLQTWEEHILNLFSIGFDQSKNPLLSAPTPRGRRVRAPEDADVFFHPVAIKGDWLRVKWDLSESEEAKVAGTKIYYAWIRWKENNYLIIERFYFV